MNYDTHFIYHKTPGNPINTTGQYIFIYIARYFNYIQIIIIPYEEYILKSYKRKPRL